MARRPRNVLFAPNAFYQSDKIIKPLAVNQKLNPLENK